MTTKLQASSCKLQAASFKLQAASCTLQAAHEHDLAPATALAAYRLKLVA
jgi:hypothetical protein